MEASQNFDSDEEERSPEEALLYSSRHGDTKTVLSLVQRSNQPPLNLDINCRGVNKANLGWTPLHLASYFGHVKVVEILLKHGAVVDVLNDIGDTALHRAAFTGRLDCVMLLLKNNANVNIKNIEGHYPKDVAKTKEIRELIEAAVAFDLKKAEEDFINLARNGETDKIVSLLKDCNAPNINCVDKYGNTALHWAAYGGHKKVAVVLLQNGIDPTKTNHEDRMAIDIASNNKMKQVLDVKPIKNLIKTVERYEGPLLKKSRIMGWKPYWVVVDKGVLSLFKTRADATTGSRRKGCKYLDQARIESHKDVVHVLTIYFADKSKFCFAVELTEMAVVKRQKWENVIVNHIAYASQLVTMGGHVSEDDDFKEDVLPLGSMQDTLQTAEAHQQVMEKEIMHVTQKINQLADERIPNKQITLLELRQQLNCVLSASQEMCINFRHCLTMFTQQEELRKVQIQQETEKSRVLEEALHVLAEEHHELERSVGKQLTSKDQESDDEDDDFFDCHEPHVSPGMPDYTDMRKLENGNTLHLTHSLNGISTSKEPISTTNGTSVYDGKLSKWNGRCILPAPMLTRKDFSVWTFLKQCIGKELSKITMPVIFNEPLSFLQRMAEYMEYSDLLKKAVACDDPVDRLEYIAAFAVSTSAANLERVGKPFNPLLGETYELNREDLGYKLICEQVSHHPPVSAFYVESPDYTFHGSVHPKLKFWGKSVEATPKGIMTLRLLEHDEVYTWENVICCIHNIIVGKLWIEHYGTMEINNHKTGHHAVLNFKPSGWFSKDLHKIDGFICDKRKKKLRAFYGKWTESLYSHDVKEFEKWLQRERRFSKPPQQNLQPQTSNGSMKNNIESHLHIDTCKLHLKDEKLLWLAEQKPHYSKHYYNFTLFALMINEMRECDRLKLAPTDSRLRPDIRKLEEGDLDGASAEKHRLEEKQRASRKLRNSTNTEWVPRWFKESKHPKTGEEMWNYTGEYWDPERKNVPDIF